MALSFVVLLGLIVVGAVALGGLVLSVVLLINEKTRLLGAVLLAVLLLGVPVVVIGVAFILIPVAVMDTPRLAPPPVVRAEPPVRVQPPRLAPPPVVRTELPVRVQPPRPQPAMAEDTPSDTPKETNTHDAEVPDSEAADHGDGSHDHDEAHDEPGDEAGALWLPGDRSVRWQNV